MKNIPVKKWLLGATVAVLAGFSSAQADGFVLRGSVVVDQPLIRSQTVVERYVVSPSEFDRIRRGKVYRVRINERRLFDGYRLVAVVDLVCSHDRRGREICYEMPVTHYVRNDGVLGLIEVFLQAVKPVYRDRELNTRVYPRIYSPEPARRHYVPR